MKKKDILFLLVCTCIVVFAWITFTIIHTAATSTINETLSQQILPIDPSFNLKVIDQLRSREVVVPKYEFGSTATKSSTPVFPAESVGSQSASISPLPVSPSPTTTPSTNSAQLQP